LQKKTSVKISPRTNPQEYLTYITKREYITYKAGRLGVCWIPGYRQYQQEGRGISYIRKKDVYVLVSKREILSVRYLARGLEIVTLARHGRPYGEQRYGRVTRSGL
jgi:hypothetical protein